MSARRIRLDLSRADWCLLLDAMECLIEEIKYHEGSAYIEAEAALAERLRDKLGRHDRGPVSA